MTELLHKLLICTVSGSVMFGLGTLFNLNFRKNSMSRWYYGIIILSLIMLLVPLEFGGLTPKLINVTVPRGLTEAPLPPPPIGAAADASRISPITVICAVWLTVALVLAARAVIMYFRARRTIKRISRPCEDPNALRICEELRRKLKIRGQIRVMIGSDTQSPLLFGIIRPRIIIPDRDFDSGSLRLIFAHELTHLKHRDLVVKLLGVAAGCVHWFNPVIYPLRKSLNTVCELCCDESVLRTLKLRDNKDYGRLIISVVEDSGPSCAAYSTSMASAKKSMKKRLSRIAQFREITGALKMISVLTAGALTVCSLTAFGLTRAAEILPEEIAPVFEGNAKSVTSKFSAEAPVTPLPSAENELRSNEPENVSEPESDAEAPNAARRENITPDAANDGLNVPQNEVLAENTANEQPSAEQSSEEQSSEEQSSEEQSSEERSSEEPEPQSSNDRATVREAPAAVTAPAPPTAVPTVEAPRPDTVKVPGVSSYVLNLEYGADGKASTPILEAASTAKIGFTLTLPAGSVEIYKCDAYGGAAELIYGDDKSSVTSFKLPVAEGEYFYAVFGKSEIDESNSNTLIIK